MLLRIIHETSTSLSSSSSSSSSLRDQSLTNVVGSLTTYSLLREADILDKYRRSSCPNLYHRVRALLFLHASKQYIAIIFLNGGGCLDQQQRRRRQQRIRRWHRRQQHSYVRRDTQHYLIDNSTWPLTISWNRYPIHHRLSPSTTTKRGMILVREVHRPTYHVGPRSCHYYPTQVGLTAL